MQMFPERSFFSFKKSKLPRTEYMDKCCKLITKACWDGNFCFMGHSRLDENKTATLQSPALKNKLFWAHNLTHDQANRAGSMPGIWGAGQQVNQPAGKRRARQAASQPGSLQVHLPLRQPRGWQANTLVVSLAAQGDRLGAGQPSKPPACQGNNQDSPAACCFLSMALKECMYSCGKCQF